MTDKSKEIKAALIGMVYQFAYRETKDGKEILWHGCMSALEEAFQALGWESPIEESKAWEKTEWSEQ